MRFHGRLDLSITKGQPLQVRFADRCAQHCSHLFASLLVAGDIPDLLRGRPHQLFSSSLRDIQRRYSDHFIISTVIGRDHP